MLGFERLLSSRRRRGAAAPARARIEPTLPDPLAPSTGRVRCRIRFNGEYAVALTEQDAQLHGVTTADLWQDALRGDQPSREIVLDLSVPDFAEPARSPMPADAAPIAVDAVSEDARFGVDGVPTPAVASTPVATPCRAPAELLAKLREARQPPHQPPPQPPARVVPPTLSPLEHARRLLAWCRRHGYVGDVIIFDMQRAYAAMCVEEGIAERPWNPVSRELTVLATGEVGKKSYVMFRGEKRRVFRIPAAIDDGAPSEGMRAAA